LGKKLFFLFIFIIISIFNIEDSLPKNPSNYDMIGLRGGIWRVSHSKSIVAPPEYKVSTKTYSPYMELYFTHGLKKDFSLEFLFGSLSRGEIKFDLAEGYYWESVKINYLSLGGKYSLSTSEKSKTLWHPYLDAGLSFVLGSMNLDYGSFGSDQSYFFSGFVKTRSAFGFFGGSGLDFSMSEYLWLNLDLKYQWAKFGSEFGGLKDYSGIRLNLGLSYVIKEI
jgi:opacity protein-like surface antigen